MASIDHTNYRLLAAIERDYARILRDVVTKIFDGDVEIAHSFQQSLKDSPVHERLLALHESPLEVAASLVGRPVDERMRGQYDRLLADVHSEHPPEAFDELENAHDRPSAEFIGYLLNRLGYKPVHQIGDDILIWTPSTSSLPKDFLRPIVLTPMLTEERIDRGMASKETIWDFLNYVFMRHLSNSDLEFILKALFSNPKIR